MPESELDMSVIRVEIQVKDPSFELEGQLYIDHPAAMWKPIEVIQDGSCQHFSTMCNQCSRSWLTEYWVRIVHNNCGHAVGINEVPGLPNFVEGFNPEAHRH